MSSQRPEVCAEEVGDVAMALEEGRLGPTSLPLKLCGWSDKSEAFQRKSQEEKGFHSRENGTKEDQVRLWF